VTQKTADTQALTQAGLNLIGQALSIYDSGLRLAVCNRMFREMFDLPKALVTPGARFSDTIRFLAQRGDYGPLDDLEGFVQARVDQALAFEPHYMERTRANGQVISVEGSPLPQGGWVTVYTDITPIKRQEALLSARSEVLSEQVLAHTEELARANRALAATNAALEEAKRQLTEMESRARLTAEMMPAHIARLGPDRRYTYSNRGLARIIPGRPAQLVGLTTREALGEEACEKIAPHLDRAYRGEASVFEFSHGSSGRRIRVAFTPDRDGAEGEVRGVYVLSMDVTEEAQARAALMQTRKRELAAQLTSGLAHDFSNLLTIILGLQSRLAKMGLAAAAHEMVEATSGAARRGGVLLDRIASISGRREMRFEPVDVARLVRGIETLASPSLPRGVTLEAATKSLPGPVLLDPGAVQDSLLNLVLNAKDAIGEGPGRIRLEVRPIRETWLEFRVSDTGPGFSAEALAHALDPFFSTKGGEGSGLGLSMVYDQTQMAGGTVELSNGKRGAVVTLRLPLRAAAPAMDPRLVLLIEDSLDLRESVREMLTGLGHQVIEAASADEAEDLVGIDGIGLVLSDILLAGSETGSAFLARMRAGGLTAPACLMTSLSAGDARRADTGFPVIQKPFTQGELAAFLAEEFA
jgi:signal transduction histidine kinase/CheY-like chemotaxis protein